MAKWLDKYEQGGLVLKKKTKDNYGKKPNVNDVKVSAGPGFEGDGYTAQNWKSPAWGGQFAMGGKLQNGDTLPEKVLVHDPQDYEGGHMYALKKTVTPYKTNQKIKKYTKATTNPEDIDFLHNYRHTSGVDNKNATAVPYEGDRHWNIDRFITDPAFGKNYPNLKSDDGSIEAERRNVLADMFKYQMYQHPEQSRGKSFREAKRFVRNEIDPRVEGPYFQNYMREGVYPVNTGGLTTFTNNNPFFEAWETMQGEEDQANREYRKNPWDDAKIEEVAKDYLKNTKKLSRKETKEQIKKWKDESKSMIQDYLNPKPTPQTGGEPIKEYAMGGGIPGAVGFTYARVAGSAPANGKYTKKTKASAQDGRVLNDRNPVRQKMYGAPEEDKVIDWFKQYYGSDFFKTNLERGNAKVLKIDPEKISKSVINDIDNTKTVYAKTDKEATYSFPGRIIMGNPEIYGNQPKNETYAHEQGHTGQVNLLASQYKNLEYMANRAKGRKKYIYDLQKNLLAPIAQNSYGPEFKSEDEKRRKVLNDYAENEINLAGINHGFSQTEQRADIMALRYLAAKKGIWDASKSKPGSFTAEMLNKLYKTKELNTPITNKSPFGTGVQTTQIPDDLKKGDLKNVAPPKSPGTILPELRRNFKDSDILYLMNNLAKNEGEAPTNKAQNGQEMKFYQEGLDFKPKSISKNGSVIKDDMGQWAHPGEVTEIDSNDITMQGVDYPVLGISDTGDTKMMQPGEDYKFDGEKVTEFPMMEKGGWLDKFDDKAQEGKDIPKGYTLPTVTVTSSKPSKWGNMKFAPYDPSNQPTISQWNPKPGEREAMAAAEQARKDEENSLYNNKHIKALRNSAFADWRPYALAGGLTALPAIGSALGLGSTGAAMSTPIAAGITANHLLGAYFVKQGINNLPETSQSVKTAYNNPTSENITNAINDVAWNTLDLFPAASTVSKIGKEAKGVYNTIATGESALPIAWKSKANTSSSNYVDDLITSGRSYLEQKAGEKLAGAENRKAIAEGNKWFEDWANHPETERKIRQQIIDQKTFGKNNPEIFDRINTPETMGNYEYLTTYKPGATEYPLADQWKDLIKTILGKNEYRTPMIHGDNSGVSYRHGLSPWTSNTTSMDYYTPGDRLSGPGTWISRDPLMNQAGRKSVTIHENTHDWLRKDPLTRLGYKDEIESHLSQEAMDASTKWIESGYDTNKNYLGYLADPTEVHARIMQARHHFGLTPTDKVTSEMAESMLKAIKQGKTPINKQFADIFSSPKGAAQLFNKLPAIAPVAVGVGAAATTLPKEQKNGGWLNKYK